MQPRGDLVPTDWSRGERGDRIVAHTTTARRRHRPDAARDAAPTRSARWPHRASTSRTGGGRRTGGGWPTCPTSSDSPTCSSSRGRPGSGCASRRQAASSHDGARTAGRCTSRARPRCCASRCRTVRRRRCPPLPASRSCRACATSTWPTAGSACSSSAPRRAPAPRACARSWTGRRLCPLGGGGRHGPVAGGASAGSVEPVHDRVADRVFDAGHLVQHRGRKRHERPGPGHDVNRRRTRTLRVEPQHAPAENPPGRLRPGRCSGTPPPRAAGAPRRATKPGRPGPGAAGRSRRGGSAGSPRLPGARGPDRTGGSGPPGAPRSRPRPAGPLPDRHRGTGCAGHGPGARCSSSRISAGSAAPRSMAGLTLAQNAGAHRARQELNEVARDAQVHAGAPVLPGWRAHQTGLGTFQPGWFVYDFSLISFDIDWRR